MGKKRNGVNKSQEIKKALAAAPDKLPKQISEELKAQGVDVTPAHVSTIKSNLRAEAGGLARKSQTAGGMKGTRKGTSAVKSGKSLTFEHLQQAKELSRQLGGVEKAREALNALSQLRE